MKKSVNLYFNKAIDTKEKIKAIKDAGFDEFFTGIKDDTESLSVYDQCKLGFGFGLKCTMIHCLYYEPQLHCFWESGKDGDLLCDDYCAQIEKAKGLTENFVVHLNAHKDQEQTEIGITRLKKMLKVCEKCGINLCIENLYSETEIPYIFERIKHDKLKICFDVGHKNFLTPNFQLMENFHKHVAVLHLHDNHGKADEHLICGKGSIDWKKFAGQLKLVPNIVLSAEVKQKNADINYLRDVYESLSMIDSL